VTWPAR